MVHISYIKLIRTNITPYVSQRTEKGRPSFIDRSIACPPSPNEVVLHGSVVLRVASCRVGLEWFLKIHHWCNSLLLDEKQIRPTRFVGVVPPTTHKLGALKW
jgi:hypothetical protein